MGASFCSLAKFRKRCVLFSMNEVKRLAKESLELDVVEVIREVPLKNIGRIWVVVAYSYYSLYYERKQRITINGDGETFKAHIKRFERKCFFEGI